MNSTHNAQSKRPEFSFNFSRGSVLRSYLLLTKMSFRILNKIWIQISLLMLREAFPNLITLVLRYEYSQLSNCDRFLHYNTLSKINRNQIENQGKRHYQVMRIKSGHRV